MTPAGGVALVTGGGRGIGEAIAARLSTGGWRVAVAARSADALARVAETTGAFPVQVDVADATAVSAAVAQVEAELGPLTLLVNNAGAPGVGGPTWEKEPTDWWHVFEVNVLGTFHCARAVLPGMLARRSGRIVNVGSNAAFFALEDDWDNRIDSAYLASKAAVVRLTEALASEARAGGVSVFAISPGMVKTAMTEPVFADLWDEPEVWATPQLTAELVAFLASGALDALSGRYIHAVNDDWQTMPDRVAAIREQDLNALRLRQADD